MKQISNITTFQELEQELSTHNNILIKFSAKWCNPCKLVSKPLKDYLESNYDDLVYVDIDIDEFDDIDEYFNIDKIPYFVIYKEGNKTNDFISGNIKDIVSNLDKILKEKYEFSITEDF